MAYNDFSSVRHRVENLSKSQFVKAYASLHAVISTEAWADKPISDLRVVLCVLDAQLAQMFDFPITTLVGMLVDLDNEVSAFKTGSGRAESGEG